MSIVSPRATLRWNEWIPLITQQQRLRNLNQIIAYNINPNEKCTHIEVGRGKCSYYYTLHLTTMSAPFYTSEKIESENPKWADDIEISEANGAAKGVVIRVWCHPSEGVEQVVTVWGVYFSGLVYLGARQAATDPSLFHSNTIVLHMKGGYFTAAHSLKDVARANNERLNSSPMTRSDVRPSYSVSLLLRLHSIQQAIKQHSVAAASLRERIAEGGVGGAGGVGGGRGESAMLTRLLHRTKPPSQPRHPHLAAVRRQVEEVRFRVSLLSHERDKKRTQLRQRIADKDKIADENIEKNRELIVKYTTLRNDVEKLKDLKRKFIETKENLFTVNSMLQALRRKRIAELNIIYPISQIGNDKFAICGVHLPNSEDFAGQDEVMISVALGFVAHLIQMIAFFLHVPLRYPVIHAGSRSKVLDHITEKIPEKEREFPLYSRGKDKLQFNYAVYLLNKNIAQLRWYCNLATVDLRATLHNLLALLNLKPSHNAVGLEASKRTMSSSTLDLPTSGRKIIERHRPQIQLAQPPAQILSYSLDKGLDQLNRPRPSSVPRQRSITHNSEPPEGVVSSEDDGQKEFLHSWLAQGPAPISSDLEVDSEKSTRNSNDLAQSPAPEESLASMINKMNSPVRLESRHPMKTEVGVEIEDDSFLHESIRQVTSRHVFFDS